MIEFALVRNCPELRGQKSVPDRCQKNRRGDGIEGVRFDASK